MRVDAAICPVADNDNSVPVQSGVMTGLALLRTLGALVGIAVLVSFLGSLIDFSSSSVACSSTVTSTELPAGLRGMCVPDAVAVSEGAGLLPVLVGQLSSGEPLAGPNGIVLFVEAGVVVSAELVAPTV